MTLGRHGSATRFGDLFDWPLLAQWLQRGRGVKGGIVREPWVRAHTKLPMAIEGLRFRGSSPECDIQVWEEFLERTNRQIDAVGDLAMSRTWRP